MSERTKLDLEELESLLDEERQSGLNFAKIYTILVLNWQWFLLSVLVCLGLAYAYLRYAEPVYQVSARMLIKDDDSRMRRSNQLLANMENIGFMSNSSGIDNEVEVLQSHSLARDAVRDLKLYTEYRSKGRLKKQLIYGTQPVTVDLDPAHLDSLDLPFINSIGAARSVSMKLTRRGKGLDVEGKLLSNGAVSSEFHRVLKGLPASFTTEIGTLTFRNVQGYEMEEGQELLVTIRPPMAVANGYIGALSVEPTTKFTSIALLSLRDRNAHRGMDFLRQLSVCYNRQANADKNEIALKTEEFINKRLTKIDKELGTTESNLESFKRRNSVTNLSADASQSLQMSSQYATKLSEANSQIQLLDYLREYVDRPSSRYQLIPSNVGLTDGASTALIASYNQAVQDRNRILKAASEQAPQVQTLTATLDELQASIRQALLQARRSADIQRQGIQNEYSKYQSRVSSTPEQERILTQIGRQQEVKSGLYLMLLQKREENAISLAATADNGKLIDTPQFEGKVSPKSSMIMLVALIIGLLIPAAIIFLINFFRYKIEGHEDVVQLTKLPVVADVAMASEAAKGKAGIVVQPDRNSQMDEIFRSLRTNLQFMLQGDERVILFTSSMSGEGKTFNAANLAVSFALLGKRTVLCGLDIRKPALGRLFGLSNTEAGITMLLSEKTVTKEAIHRQIQPSGIDNNLDLLLAGPIPPNPAELLAREQLVQVLDLLKEEYDYIILDTAPVGLVTDTLQIARLADVSVYVCRADYTPKSFFSMLNSLDEEKKLPKPCVLLNGVDMSKKKYGYYYGYGKYGKYGKYGRYGRYSQYGKKYGYGGSYGNYGTYSASHYGNKEDNSVKR
jgi:capsular exopolysaccharide synthesis family protein